MTRSLKGGLARSFDRLSDRLGGVKPVFASFGPGDASWIAPASGTVIIRAWSGGASGAVFGGGSSPQTVTGGGGGAYGEKRLEVSLGQSLSVSVGAGGPPVSGYGGSSYDGKDGGPTSVTFPGGGLALTGGRKGVTAANASPSAGGVASGGDVNRDGGRGGTPAQAPEVGRGTNPGAPGTNDTQTLVYGGGGAGGPDDRAPVGAGRGGSYLTYETGGPGAMPGGGGSTGSASSFRGLSGAGGDGLVIIEFYEGGMAG